MKLLNLIVVFVFLQLLLVDVSYQQICHQKMMGYTSEPYSYLQYHVQVYYVSCGWWRWRRCRATRAYSTTAYANRNITVYHSKPVCCARYTGYPNCQPICSQGCHNGGTCILPNICRCSTGWTGSDCTQPICSQGCHNGGTCILPNICRCSTGWTGSDCTKPICSQGCHNGGTCILPNICRCSTGWTGSDCTKPICSKGCYNNGTCVMPEMCNCTSGWTDKTCRTPICLPECQNGGTCILPNVCVCSVGWTGPICTTPLCKCHNGGYCISPYVCKCLTGWTGSDCRKALCSQTCFNKGVCIKPNICGCKGGWTGHNCTTPHCPQGCYNGKCMSPNICTCNPGWTGSNCTKDINECTNPRACGHNQRCINTVGSYKCECHTGFEPDLRARSDVDTYYHCTDIDECEDDHKCSQICKNQYGSFYCECRDGFMLQADGKQCLDVNECLDNNADCDHSCVNILGSYYCKCNSGYQLQADKHNCTDIMECKDGLHNCLQVCVELQGEFSCTCYDGYELLEDGVSCKEINFCETGVSGCEQLCIHTNGSFYCDCLTGYQLLSDNMTCQDINECDKENGGCGQTCTNTVGSYHCTCEEGYTLDFNGFNCTALPCPFLMDPRNGKYDCDAPHVTGTVCKLDCDQGYELVGVENRKCLSTSKWSANHSYCEILHCDELNNSENGNIILPCATKLGTECKIVCSPGFYTNSSSITQECKLVNESTAKWSEPPKCIEKELCYPNPCKHNGICSVTEENDFICDCDGVGYTGKTCDILLINVPGFSIIAINHETEFSVSSSPDREFILRLHSDDRSSLKAIPSPMTFSQTRTHYNGMIKAKKPGLYTLMYKVNDPTLRYQPMPSAIILVTNGTAEKSDYFDTYGVKPGVLKSGGCSSDMMFHIKCPSRQASSLFLQSTCRWNKRDNFYYSPGVIFSSDNKFDMPVAIAGAKVRLQEDNQVANLLSLNNEEFESDCTECNYKSSDVPTRSKVKSLTLNDVQSFLCNESLASTYFHYSSKLIPNWLKLNTLSSNRTHNIHSYIVDLISSDKLKNIGECAKLTAITDGVYSVMLYSGFLRAKIHKEPVQFQSTSSPVFCFAVNLCKGSSSPLYIGIPDEVQTELQSLEFMRDLKSKGWTINVNSLAISDSRISKMKSNMEKPTSYWNGKEYFTLYRQQPKMVTSVKFSKQFSGDDTVKAYWYFHGDILWLHDNINKAFNMHNVTWNVYFNGFTRLRINIPVYGEVSSIQLINKTEPAYLRFRDLNKNVTCHGCSDPSGIAFKLLYHIAGGTNGFFSTLLAVPQKGIDPQYNCPLDSFIFLNKVHDLEAVSIASSCLGINLGLFPIHDLETHIYVFNECKIDSLCAIVKYTDANIVVWSTFPSSLSELSLGHFLKLLPVSASNRTGLVATFSKEYNQLYAVLPNVNFSLFDTTFNSEAIINEQQLTFSRTAKLYDKYHVKLSGKIKQITNWENIAIEVQGMFLNNSDNIPKLLCYQIAAYIDILYNRSQVELNNAEVVYNKAVMQFIKANATYNKHKINKNQSSNLAKQLQDEYNQANNTLYLITEKLEKASDKVKNLQKDIDDLCTIKQCPEVCISQQICEECRRNVTVPIQGICIFQCIETKNITVITGTEVTTRWEYRPKENCFTNKLCQGLPCVVITTCELNFIIQPVDYTRIITETVVIEISSNCSKPCSETVVAAPLTALCCANFTCNSVEKEVVECLNQNQQCTQAREIAYLNFDEAEENATKILQILDEAQRNETIAKLRLQRSKVNYNISEKKFNESKRAYSDASSTLEIASASLEAVKNKTELAELERVKSLNICGFDPPSFLEIKSVTFESTIITESPTTLAVDTVIFIASQNITVTETLYIDFNNLDTSLKQGAVAITEKLVLSQNTLSKRHSRSSSNGNALDENELYFQRKCADAKNILDYIKELNTSIFTVAESTILSISGLKDNVLELSKLVNYSSSIFNEELAIDFRNISKIINRNSTYINSTDTKKYEENDEFVKLMQEHVRSSQELERELGNILYQSWQAKMEDLHNQTGSAAGFPCIGFSGCLQKVVDTLNDLISDIPLSDILSDFSDAAKDLMDLALLQNYSIVSAVTNTHNVYNIASNSIITDYWCADVPRIIVHPVQYINSTENSTIQLSCKADIEQRTSYQWKKDGIQLLYQKSTTLVLNNVKVSDSGNYTCVATNQVGSTTSFNATVEVLQFPSFRLQPSNIYEYFGNLNGAIFQCNASGSPLPGYKWYFQPTGGNEFTEITNNNQNVLVILPPLPKDEGYYYCEAFIGNMSIHSRVASLTVLHSTVVQVAQTVYLNFSFIEETETDSEEDSSDYFTSDSSGSGINEIGSGININVNITPYTKLALQKNLVDVLNTLMSFESTTVGNVSLNFVTPFNLAVSFTLYSRNITYSEATLSKINQLAPQAMKEWADTWQKLQELLSVSGFIITDNEYEYESLPPSLIVDMLQFVCPGGKEVSSTNNFICANCPPGSYQILDVQRVIDENDGRVTLYTAPKCVSCPVGYYQDGQGHDTCKQCPTVLASGAKECVAQCSPGKYSESGLEPCLTCPNETYSFINGSTTCYSCRDEKYQMLCLMYKINGTKPSL